MIGFHYCPGMEETPVDEAANVVFDVSDKPEGTHPFGSPCPSNEREWLWQRNGRLLIISVPYRHGRHYAQRISDFVPILKHLIHIHKYGKVHGDIRAFNTVFKDKKNGWLIDLDFGGVAGEVDYPKNFNFTKLDDGKRLHATGKIQKFHDYYALWKVFSALHGTIEVDPDYLVAVQNTGIMVKNMVKNTLRDSPDPECKHLQTALSNFFTKWGHIRLHLELEFDHVIKQHKGTDQPNENKKQVTEKGSPFNHGKTNRAVATGSLCQHPEE